MHMVGTNAKLRGHIRHLDECGMEDQGDWYASYSIVEGRPDKVLATLLWDSSLHASEEDAWRWLQKRARDFGIDRIEVNRTGSD